jgi:hypothetical protein
MWNDSIVGLGVSAGTELRIMKRFPRAVVPSFLLDRSHYTEALHSLGNGFSRKLENHAAGLALNYFSYNFIKIHRTLRMSPAMAAGVTDRLWSVEDLVAPGKPMSSGGRKEQHDNNSHSCE